MQTQKNLFLVFGEWWETRRSLFQNGPKGDQYRTRHWLVRQLIPNLGSVLLVLLLLGVFPGLAAPSSNAAPPSISTIPYQGRLADVSGTPLTGKQTMIFSLYDSSTSTVPLWTEHWDGGNSVDVSDGLFSVLLGSIEPGLSDVVQSHNHLYLGVTVGTDSEMVPRVQLGSVPFAMTSLTVTDESITEAKIADGAVTRDKLAPSAIPQPMQSGSISLSSPPPNYPTSHDWVDIQELQTVIQIDQPSVVFVAGHIFVEGDSTAISDMRVIIGDSISGDTRYQGRFWQTAPLNHVTHLQPGTHTIKVQIRAYPDSPIAGDGHIGYPTSLSYFVQPEP